jgi:hypothetical protein
MGTVDEDGSTRPDLVGTASTVLLGVPHITSLARTILLGPWSFIVGNWPEGCCDVIWWLYLPVVLSCSAILHLIALAPSYFCFHYDILQLSSLDNVYTTQQHFGRGCEGGILSSWVIIYYYIFSPG